MMTSLTTAALRKAHQEQPQAAQTPRRLSPLLDGRPDALSDRALRGAQGQAENDQSRAELLGFCRSCLPAIEQQVKVLAGEGLKQREES